MLTGRQIAAARTLLGISQADLAGRSNISVPTLKRMEGSDGAASGMANNVGAVKAALESAGVVFLDGTYSGTGGPGVRLTEPADKSIDAKDTQTVQYREHLKNDAPPGAGG